MTDLSTTAGPGVDAHQLVGAFAVPVAVRIGPDLVAANDALCRLAGRTFAELQALEFAHLVAEEDRDPLERACRACFERGEVPPAVSARLLTPGGGERHVEIHVRPVQLGQARAAVLTCVDQSDIMHVQNSLFGMSEMLRQIVDGAPVAAMVIDQDHLVTHWNTACERLTGVQRYDMIGTRDSWRAFRDDQRPLLADLIVDGFDEQTLASLYGGTVRVVHGGLEAEAFFPRIGASGAWLYFTASPLRDAQGKIIGAVETLQDITERRRVQEELMRHHDELELLVQKRSAELSATARELEGFVSGAPIGVAYSVGKLIQRVNGAMASMFGYTEQEMAGMPGSRLYLPDQDSRGLEEYLRSVMAGGASLHHEMWLRRADGKPIWVQVDARLAAGAAGEQGIWWMMQDRTDIRSAQDQLRMRFDELRAINGKLEEAQNQLLQQDKMASIGQLAAGVAHEINNPVGFVSSNLNTLRQYVDGLLSLSGAYEAVLARPGDGVTLTVLSRLRKEVEIDYLREDMPQLLDECAEGLGRVKKIVQDLKDFSRVDQADWQEADLNAGLESTLNVVRHEVKYKAEVVKRLAPLPPVMCLAAQLNQVFMNLIVNAAHAIAEQGTITLSSGACDAWAWVQVDDDGCGMTDEVRRRIFEPFFTTKDVGKGTGLGLSLSFSNVQKHGGAIQVRSTPGVGSSFRVWVPTGGPDSVPAGTAPPAWTDGGAQ